MKLSAGSLCLLILCNFKYSSLKNSFLHRSQATETAPFGAVEFDEVDDEEEGAFLSTSLPGSLWTLVAPASASTPSIFLRETVDSDLLSFVFAISMFEGAWPLLKRLSMSMAMLGGEADDDEHEEDDDEEEGDEETF